MGPFVIRLSLMRRWWRTFPVSLAVRRLLGLARLAVLLASECLGLKFVPIAFNILEPDLLLASLSRMGMRGREGGGLGVNVI